MCGGWAAMTSADPQFDAAVHKLKDELHRRREATTLLRRPVATLWHFAKVVSAYSRRGIAYLAARETLLYALLLGGVLLIGLVTIPGPHQSVRCHRRLLRLRVILSRRCVSLTPH